MKFSESKDEVFYRFEHPNGFSYELAYVKAQKRFLAFRCNAFAEDPNWQKMHPQCCKLNKAFSIG
jgi:hypothetical protein